MVSVFLWEKNSFFYDTDVDKSTSVCYNVDVDLSTST